MKLSSLFSNDAFKIAVIYLVVSVIWIFFSDRLVSMIAQDSQLFLEIQTYKGWFFVLVTSILLYALIRKSNEKLNNSKDRIDKALQEKQALLTELHHRVKNNLSIICGLIDLQVNELDEDSSVALKETQYRIYTLADIEELLYQNEELSGIPFHEYINHLATTLEDTDDIDLSINTHLQEVFLNINQAVPLGLLVNEILSQLRLNRNLIDDPTVDIYLNCEESQQVNLRLSFNTSSTSVFSEVREDEHLEGLLVDLYTKQLESSTYWKQQNGELFFEISFDKSEKEKVPSLALPTA